MSDSNRLFETLWDSLRLIETLSDTWDPLRTFEILWQRPFEILWDGQAPDSEGGSDFEGVGGI